MKKLIFLAFLTLTFWSNFIHAETDQVCMDDDQECHFLHHHRQQKFVVCKKANGAIQDSVIKIRSCANVSVDDGCYCGPKHQVHALLDKAVNERRFNQ